MSRCIRNTNRKRNYFESQEIKTPRFLWRCRITELNMEKECINKENLIFIPRTRGRIQKTLNDKSVTSQEIELLSPASL